MQIQLLVDNLEEEILHECNGFPHDSSSMCLKSSESISSWMIDHYFRRISSKQIETTKHCIQSTNIIGSYEMFKIYQLFERSSPDFLSLCQNKLNQIENDCRLEKYNNYLKRCGLIDMIDLFHQCQFELVINTFTLSTKNIKNDLDRLFFEYFVQLPSSSCYLYDSKTKVSTVESKENLVKLITREKSAAEQMTSKIHIKHALCTYLSLLSDTRNEHALICCLVTFSHIGIDREIISELRRLSENQSLTVYQILLSFLGRKELLMNRMSSLSQDLTDNDDELNHLLGKFHVGLEEFFDFIEQIQKIIEENECRNIEPLIIFGEVLESITKQFFKDKLFDQCDVIIEEIIEEFCQCFEISLPMMNCSSSSRLTTSVRPFLRSLPYLCAKQSVGLPLPLATNDPNGSALTKSLCRRYKSQQCLDLSTIHETSFESDSMIDTEKDLPITTDTKISLPPGVKRQPLRKIDVNSFDNQERESERTVILTLVSDGDKENIPALTRKRSMSSTKDEPANKKQKKSNVKSSETGQKMITSFFQSTN